VSLVIYYVINKYSLDTNDQIVFPKRFWICAQEGDLNESGLFQFRQGISHQIYGAALMMAILRWKVLSNFVYFVHACVEADKIFC
jgi:hypothetical protein